MDANSDRFESGARSRRAVLATAGVAGAGLLAGCAVSDDAGSKSTPPGTGDDSTNWRTTELTDVRTDETFTIAGYEEPVVIQSFATWCGNCERQSNQLKEVSDEVNLVGLNNDLGESASKVRTHAEEHGFDWRFAVASAEMMNSLKSDFGPVVADAPKTPMIVHCPDGMAELNRGMTPSEVRTAVENC